MVNRILYEKDHEQLVNDRHCQHKLNHTLFTSTKIKCQQLKNYQLHDVPIEYVYTISL